MLRRGPLRFAAAAGAATGLAFELVPEALLTRGASFDRTAAAAALAQPRDVARLTAQFELASAKPQATLGAALDTDDVSLQRDAVAMLLRCYGAAGRIDAARTLFMRAVTELPQDAVTAPLFDVFLQLLMQQPNVSDAEVAFVLRLMQERFQLKRTAWTYQALVEMKLRLYEDCAAVWREMRADGVEPTPSVLRLLVHGAVLPGHDDIRFVMQVLRAFMTTCDVVDVNLVERIFHVVANHADSSAEHALWLLFELEQRCVAERLVLSSMIERAVVVQMLLKCARCGDAVTAERTIALMERQQMPLTHDALALLLWTYAAAGEYELAVDALEDMALRGLLDGVDHTKRFVVEALNTPIEKHYLALVADAISSKAAVDRCYARLQERKQAGKSVSVHALDVLVLACGRIGDERRALETLESYGDLDVQPRTQSYNALLLSCTGRGKARQHAVIFQAMQRSGVQPNYHTFRLLIRQAVACDNIDEALEFLDRAPTFPGVRIDVEMLLPILERAARVGDVETVVHVARFAVHCDIGIEGTILRTAVLRVQEVGVDATPIEELIPVHEKLRGKYGVGRRAARPPPAGGK